MTDCASIGRRKCSVTRMLGYSMSVSFRFRPGFVILHWLIACLVFSSFVCVLVVDDVSSIKMRVLLSSIHAGIGILVFALVLLKIVLKTKFDSAESFVGGALVSKVAKFWHALLDVSMLLTPIAGALAFFSLGRERALGFLFFSPPSLDRLETAKTIGYIHSSIAWIFGMLICGHIFAFLVHKFVLRNSIVDRTKL